MQPVVHWVSMCKYHDVYYYCYFLFLHADVEYVESSMLVSETISLISCQLTYNLQITWLFSRLIHQEKNLQLHRSSFSNVKILRLPDNKLNVFELWIVSWDKRDIWGCLGLWEKKSLSLFTILKGQITNQENNRCILKDNITSFFLVLIVNITSKWQTHTFHAKHVLPPLRSGHHSSWKLWFETLL